MNSFTFPTMLAGPIIRRVEPTAVFIWLATSSRFRIIADLYGNLSNENDHLIDTQSETETIKMGENLFIHLVKVSPANGLFPTNQLLGYNLRFESDSEVFDLADLDLLSSDNPKSIVYGDQKYPTFYMSCSESHSNILYGSCRKLHGEGEDVLSCADTLLEKSAAEIKSRPNSLFLMGDQIYADDVADPMVRVISTLGETLIGAKEDLAEIENRIELQPINQINGRAFTMKNLCRFTSSSADNHLIELGEYSAMYLLSLSPALWVSHKNFNCLNHLMRQLIKTTSILVLMMRKALRSN